MTRPQSTKLQNQVDTKINKGIKRTKTKPARLSPFEPLEIHDLIEEAGKHQKPVAIYYSERCDEQLREVLAAYEIDVKKPDAYKQALVKICGDLLGLGQLIYRLPRCQKNARNWTFGDESNLLMHVTRHRIMGFSERDAIRLIAKNPKKFPNFPYRAQTIRQSQGASSKNHENALWQRWNKIKKAHGIGKTNKGDPLEKLWNALNPADANETTDPIVDWVQKMDFHNSPLGMAIGKNRNH